MSMALDGVPRSRSTDPVTSVEAGRSANLMDSQAQVLEFLRLAKREWTDVGFVFEITRWAQDSKRRVYSQQRYRSARQELTERGLIVMTGATVKPPSGRAHRVWRLA